MSQMITDWKLDFRAGFNWNAFIEIVPTGQTRRKVIADLCPADLDRPRVTIQLDMRDDLSVVVTDHSGNKITAGPVSSRLFAYTFVWLQVEVFYIADETSLSVQIRIDGKSVARSVVQTVDVPPEPTPVTHSFGADVSTADPATFTLAQLATSNRNPLSDEEILQLNEFFHSENARDA